MWLQVASSSAWASSWFGWNQWYREVHCTESLGWKAETKSWPFQCNILNYLFFFTLLCNIAHLFHGRLQNPPDWQEILTYFRGSELQNYFTRILEDNLKVMLNALLTHNFPPSFPCFQNILNFLL